MPVGWFVADIIEADYSEGTAPTFERQYHFKGAKRTFMHCSMDFSSARKEVGKDAFSCLVIHAQA